MSHPIDDHLYAVKDGVEEQGSLEIHAGPPRRYVHYDDDDNVLGEGELRRMDPPDDDALEMIGDDGVPHGIIRESEDPDGATITWDTWPSGQMKTLHH